MKKGKTLIILAAVLVAVIAGIVIEKAVVKHIDKVNTIDEEVFTVNADDVTAIAIETSDGDLALEKTDGGWLLKDDESFPIDDDLVADFMDNFESVHASFIIEDVEDYSQYGLKDPEGTVTFTTADGDNTITFGTFSTMDEKRYICVNSENVYLIDDDLMEDVSSDKDSFMKAATVPDFSQVESVEVSGATNVEFTYEPDAEYTYTDKYDYYCVKDDDHLPLSTDLVAAYIANLTGMDTSNYVTYEATSEDLSKYELDLPDLVITISGQVPVDDGSDDEEEEETEETADTTDLYGTDTETETEEVDEDVETETQEVTVYLAAVGDDETYVRVGDSSIIYSVDRSVYDALADGSYATLRPTEVMDVDFSNVSSVICNVDGESYTVDVEDKGDDGCEYTIDGVTLDFTSAASKIQALSINEAGDSYDLGKEELNFTVNLNDDAGTKLNVILYRYDGDNCVTTLNGQTIGLTSRDSMSTLREKMISSILNLGKEDDTEE